MSGLVLQAFRSRLFLATLALPLCSTSPAMTDCCTRTAFPLRYVQLCATICKPIHLQCLPRLSFSSRDHFNMGQLTPLKIVSENAHYGNTLWDILKAMWIRLLTSVKLDVCGGSTECKVSTRNRRYGSDDTGEKDC